MFITLPKTTWFRHQSFKKTKNKNCPFHNKTKHVLNISQLEISQKPTSQTT